MDRRVSTRKIMVESLSDDGFFKMAADCVSEELGCNKFLFISDSIYAFSIREIHVLIERKVFNALRREGLFCIDRYILDKLCEYGYEIDKHKSQYIRGCYGLLTEEEDVDVQ